MIKTMYSTRLAALQPRTVHHGSYRKLNSAERPLLRDHLLRLTPEDRALRFLSKVSAKHIDQYCTRVDDHYRIVIGYFVAGVMRGAGELVFNAGATWLGSCEVALSVEYDYQNGGVGAELLRRLLVLARNRGTSKVTMLCLRSNRRMRRLATKFASELHFAAGNVEGTLYPRWPDAASLLEESWEQGRALLNLVFGVTPSSRASRDETAVTKVLPTFRND